jgi:hypothetical protein
VHRPKWREQCSGKGIRKSQLGDSGAAYTEFVRPNLSQDQDSDSGIPVEESTPAQWAAGLQGSIFLQNSISAENFSDEF